MKNKNGIYIIGVDHGYGNIKTANCCFPTGLTAYDTEPLFTGNMLVYNDRYYLIGVGHKTYTPKKTMDEDYYILTLAAIAMELSRENLTEASVHISAGLPLSWVQEQKAAYHAYLLKNKEVQFTFRGVDYKISIVGADIYPQGYSAIAAKAADMKGVTLLCDIGNGTMNLLYLRDGRPDPSRMYTEKFGTQQCVNAILEAVMNKHQVVMDEGIVEEYLRTGEADVSKDFLKLMKTAVSQYVQGILRRLQAHEYTPSLMRLYVVGGGGCLIRNFAKLDSSRVTIDEDICATAKGYIAWHGYQSFKPGEVTPEQCHQLGVALAKQMWGDRFQVIVTTHLDKEHLHNHFCISSVSFKDGGKYNFSKRELKRLRDTSDRLCREHGLSVVERPHKAPSRQVWLDEQAGKPTRYNIYRADVQKAIDGSITGKGMVQHLRGRGYIVDTTGPNLKIRLPQYPHFTRLDTLNPQWTNQGIEHLIYERDDLVSSRSKPFQKPDIPDWLQGVYQPRKRTPKIYRLYLYYCYQLGILPKGTGYRPTSPQLRADLRRLDDIDRQTRFLAEHKIETLEELLEDRSQKERQLEALVERRTKLQNKIRRATPEEKLNLRKEKAEVTAQITSLRKDIRDSKEIEQRSVEIQNTLDRTFEIEHPQRDSQKQMQVNR